MFDWKDFSTMVFAWSSTIFAGLTFYYAYKTYDRDRHKIKIYISEMQSTENSEKYIMLKITNIWRRHIFISSIALKRVSKKDYYLMLEWPDFPTSKSGDLPFRLNEAEEYTAIYKYNQLLHIISDAKKDIIWFSIWDSFWNEYIWEFARDLFIELKKEIKKDS